MNRDTLRAALDVLFDADGIVSDEQYTLLGFDYPRCWHGVDLRDEVRQRAKDVIVSAFDALFMRVR